MEKQEMEKGGSGADDGSQLSRARSFKSKQLVRSQALREAQSPPRTLSPCVPTDNENDGNVTRNNVSNNVNNNVITDSCERTVAASDMSSHSNSEVEADVKYCEERKQHQVEIQITSGNWDDSQSDPRSRKGWLGHKAGDWSRDLLSNSPRVTCVCGTCACPHCRGRRRKHPCPTKQDSGIVCSEDCPDCTDSDHTGSGACDGRKWHSADSEYCSCGDRRDRRVDKTVSIDSADDKSDLSGPDLVQFIKDTLNKNSKDRLTLLKIEKELHALVSDSGRCVVRFPVMTSYGRMLVHRCAALFQLAHRLDTNNKTSVIVSKTGTSGGRLPCTSFKEWCTANLPDLHRDNSGNANNAKSILKRATQSLEEGGNSSFSQNRSKSLEQREKDYERVRSRIFSEENSVDESQCVWLTCGGVKLLTVDSRPRQLLKVQSLESASGPGGAAGGAAGGAGGAGARGAVAKSHSFGGYAAGDPPAPPHPRLLSRQGDLASSSWRLSPSSSGYKTLSLRSRDSVTPSPTGGASPEPNGMGSAAAGSGGGVVSPGGGVASPGGGAMIWALTDVARVPPGAIVIHPQSGRPLTNADGSLYHFDPNNPPALPSALPPAQPLAQVDDNNDRRRGRLEKQHSFIDTECECPSLPADECRTKCCCDCQKTSAAQQQRNPDKPPPQPQPEPKPNIKPASPCKARPESIPQTPPTITQPQETRPKHYQQEAQRQYENQDKRKQYVAPTNQRPPSYEPANQKPAYDVTANQRTSDQSINQRVKVGYQDGQEMVHYVPQQGYVQYRTEELTPPPQLLPPVYMGTELPQVLLQQKMQPTLLHDPNLRPMTLTNVVYPAPVAQGYPYLNQYRTQDAALQPAIYHPIQHIEEPKPVTTSPQTDTGFRIDPSYPYAAVDYSQCGACATAYVDASTLQQRPSYNVAYGQMELPNMMTQAYPHGMILQQPQYTYGDAMQWPNLQPVVGVSPKVMLHELYPYCGVVCPPQLVQQSYAAGGGAGLQGGGVGANGRHSKRTSPGYSHRNTPSVDDRYRPEERKPYSPHANEHNLSRQNSSEIQAKIQQIKEQMAQLSAREREKTYRKPEELKRRETAVNNNNGILGSYPVNNACNGRIGGRPVNDESQLSTTARAIVNSIRNSMQARNHYQAEYRPHYKQDSRRPPAPHNQMSSPQAWCRRSPGAAPPGMLNNPRRPHPNPRNERR